MHYIQGEIEGKLYFINSENEWTLDFSRRKIGSFEEAMEILDEIFHEGELHGVAGVIVENS